MASFVGKAGTSQHRIVAVVNALFIFFLFVARKEPWFARHFRQLNVAFILVEFLAAALSAGAVDTITALSSVLFPPLFLIFRFRRSEYVAVALCLTLTSFIGGLVLSRSVGRAVSVHLLVPLITNTFFVGAAIALMRSERRRFVSEWQVASAGEWDRRRMREELDDARKIQLAMWPDAPPPSTWIDVAGTSLPATEVGGDFFDYYELGEERLAIVIGDVAGHGVPSGLVLAAMKSGLYLLREKLNRPVAAMLELDEMVRESIRWRMLVSLLIAVVDRRGARAITVAAGHPPIVVWSARERRIVRAGHGALPLGTRLHPAYESEEVHIASGDVLLFITDGVTELSRHGAMFGDDRLVQVLSDNADLDASGIRNKLLAELNAFRGDAAQEDDVTLVVAKVR
jgi:serine phosphatase RsbU (regulator of sigma subunit)